MGLFHKPGPRVFSAVQHLAAGVVFAAVAAELLPQLRASGSPVMAALGFSLGVLVVLGVKAWMEGDEGAAALLYLVILWLEMGYSTV